MVICVGCCLCRVANSNVISKHALQPSNLKVFVFDECNPVPALKYYHITCIHWKGHFCWNAIYPIEAIWFEVT